LVKPPAVGINFDTGNSFLCGHDPYAWLERVSDRLIHLHAKDISTEQSSLERGKVTGTPVGVACGDGVIDWSRIVEICSRRSRDLVLSVECGTIPQAERSIVHLRKVLGANMSRAA
jgi:sugar phosphate isomerase/epimerase